MRSFAEHLQQFALSVDIVDDDVLEQIRGLVTRYVKDALGIAYFEMMLESKVNDQPGLKTFWTTGREFSNVLQDQGICQGQTAFAYLENLELWVVGDQQVPLVNAQQYVDLWNRRLGLPPYKSPMMDRIKTSIILPLRDEGRVFGVLDLESQEYLEITDLAKKELTRIAHSVAMLYQLRKTSKMQRDSTQKALQQLAHLVAGERVERLSKPKLFVAASSKADPDVEATLRTVLDESSARLDVVYWSEMCQSGDITQQIIDALFASRFGICYLSEKLAQRDDVRYTDNPNVLFEAGMLHALSRANRGAAEAWIPIRERDSATALPFDFITERVLFVPRLTNGAVNVQQFKAELSRRVKSLLGRA